MRPCSRDATRACDETRASSNIDAIVGTTNRRSTDVISSARAAYLVYVGRPPLADDIRFGENFEFYSRSLPSRF